MIYKEFGKTGKKVSTLGFGAMRLPMCGDGDNEVNYDLAVPMIQRSFELGVNYVDSAPYYCASKSEIAVGRALKGWRDKVYLSTKNPIENDSADDWRGRLEASLGRLDTDYIDFYHFWGIGLEKFKRWQGLSDGPIQAAKKALDEKVIRHLSFSYHDKPENFKEIIDSGLFESVLIQYNLLDRSNEENIAYAKEQGLGVVVMGPVGGGRLGEPTPVIQGLLKDKPVSTSELAMRFVLSNPYVDIALSGMSEVFMVEQNAEVASKGGQLAPDEIAKIKTMMEENKKLAEMYCTGCKYCLPCPQDINIPHIFGMMINHRVYNLFNHAKMTYGQMMRGEGWVKSADASKCTQCGACEEKCPQKLSIIKQLAETHTALA